MLSSKLDAMTKFKLLDMLDERPVAIIDQLDPSMNTMSVERVKKLMSDELEYLVIDSMLQDDAKLLIECR